MPERNSPMLERKYAIFELCSGGFVKLEIIRGLETAIKKAHELAKDTRNEIRVIYLPDNTIVAVVNQKQEKSA